MKAARALLLCVLLCAALRAAHAAVEPLLLGENDRLLVLAPHPDDETIAAAGLIQEALALDVPVRVCFFTMGDNNELSFLLVRKHPVLLPTAVRNMGLLRQGEAIAAAQQLGLAPDDLVFLGHPDFGTLEIWKRHWRDAPPYRSMLTRATAVPYESALTPGSAHAGEDVLDDLLEVLRDFAPTHVAVSHPADHNVDHRALYLFARVALWDLESEGIAPELLPYPVHFSQWPEPRRIQTMRPASPPHFLLDDVPWLEYDLAPFQVTNKLAALRRHASQYAYASAYLDSFVRKSELFGDFPDVLLPGGIGSNERHDDDLSQFRPDDSLFADLSGGSPAWDPIARQRRDENDEIAPHDNDFARQTIAGDGARLILSFEFHKPLSRAATLSVHAFGYRAETPFGEMPKIEIAATSRGIETIRDLAAPLPASAVAFHSPAPEEIELRIPYELLGNPDRILLGARLAFGPVPIDWLPWRAIDLGGAPLSPPPFAAAENPPPAPAPAPAAAPAPPPPPPPPRADGLVPRVRLPKNDLPAWSEANEPVRW